MEKTGYHWFSLRTLFRDRFTPFRENSKFIAIFLLAVLFITVGAWFFKHQQPELGQIKNFLLESRLNYIITGIAITIIYIVLQGFMYKMSFASVGKKVAFSSAILVFLKRNFISIFMPAGSVAALAFFTDEVEEGEASKTKIHFASSIYAFTGIVTVVLVAIPILIYAVSRGLSAGTEIFALLTMILIVSAIYFLYKSLVKKNFLYRIFIKLFPSSEVFIDEIKYIEVGLNFSESPLSYDLVLTTTFNSESDLEKYMNHPEHKKVLVFLNQVTEKKALVDYEI